MTHHQPNHLSLRKNSKSKIVCVIRARQVAGKSSSRIDKDESQTTQYYLPLKPGNTEKLQSYLVLIATGLEENFATDL